MLIIAAPILLLVVLVIVQVFALIGPVADGTFDGERTQYKNHYGWFINAWVYDQVYDYTVKRDRRITVNKKRRGI